MTLKDTRTYSDIVKNNEILPKKKKYNINDLNNLVSKGYSHIQARFIIICSAIYHYDIGNKAVPQYMYTDKFVNKCNFNDYISKL